MTNTDGGNTKKSISPEPPPLQHDDNLWLDDVMHNITNSKMHTLKYCVSIDPEIPNPNKDTDFSCIQPCTCTTNCNKHYTFTQPHSPSHINKHAPAKINDLLLDDLPILDKELLASPKINTIGRSQIIKGQNDIGANTSVTNEKDAILLYQDITPLPIGGVHKDDPAIVCTGKGCIIWTAQK